MSKARSLFLQTLPDNKYFYTLILAVLIVVCSIVFLPSRKINGQQTSLSCPTCSQPIQRTIYAPTIGLAESTGSEIVLNCRSIQMMNVTPTFYTAEGTPIVGATFQMKPSEMRFVAIETLIPEEHRGQHIWGGMSLSYTGRALEMWAQITLHGLGGIGSADVTFSVLDNRGSDTQEALWWMPNGDSAAIIALGNSSNAPIRTRLQYSSSETEEVDIAPFATRYIHRQRGSSVKLTTTGPAGSLKAMGFVTNSSQKFTSGIRFYDTQGVVQPNLFATNFKLKNHSSHLLLKNTATTNITVRPRFRPMSGTGSAVELPQVAISAGENVELDLRPLIEAARTRNDLAAVSVQIVNNGSPGSLIGALYSTDRTTGVNQDIPLRDSGRLRNSTGAYPWRLDDDYSTVVSITNVGSQTAQFSVKIYYDGGTYTPKLSELAVGETAAFNLRKLRDERIPDQSGNIIPATATVGQFSWSALRAADEIRMNGRSEVVSLSRRISSSYSCPICCPNSGPFYSVNGGITPYVDGFSSNGTNQEWYDCYGRSVIYDESIPDLFVSDPNIASVSMESFGIMRTDGLDVGETEWFTEHLTYRYDDDGMDCYTFVYNTISSGPIRVRPPTVQFQKADGTTLGSNFRVGISAASNDRTQHLKAVVSPANQTTKVSIQVSSAITLSNVSRGNGVITFDIVGNTKSNTRGDASITAKYNSTRPIKTQQVSVVVPAKIATPHDTTGNFVVANRALDSTTSPAIPLNTAPLYLLSDEVYLVTEYSRYLTITVKDQFDDLIGDIYEGAVISETIPINQTLTSSSTYLDPVGYLVEKPTSSIVKRNSSAASNWLSAPQLQIPITGSSTQNIDVRVDGFLLNPSIVNRIINVSPPSNVTITWAN